MTSHSRPELPASSGRRVLLPPVARVLICPASFKGSLSAAEAAEAMALGVSDTLPHASIDVLPLSDGGEGLVSVLAPALRAGIRTSTVQGPLASQRVDAQWAMTADRSTAVLEMASAAGIMLVPEPRRDPRFTTTYGVGELIVHALDAGASHILLGLGGSATNDGGTGMARALGYRFTDSRGCPIAEGGDAIRFLCHIDSSHVDRRLDAVSVTAACDVANPFFGSEGATMVYAPQKGARPEHLELLDQGLKTLANVILNDCGCDIASLPGSGAAGGMGGGVVAFLHGRLKRGIDIVLDTLEFDAHLRAATIVITGEGKLDEQTRHGKVINGVTGKARTAGVPVAAVVGTADTIGAESLQSFGLADLETLTSPHVSVEQAILNAATLIRARTGALLQRLAQP